jgi:hypothetical protein
MDFLCGLTHEPNLQIHVSFEALTVVMIQDDVFWIVTMCNFEVVYQRSEAHATFIFRVK